MGANGIWVGPTGGPTSDPTFGEHRHPFGTAIGRYAAASLRGWKELKGACRSFNQAQVDREQIQRVHVERTQAACRQPGEYLLIEDTGELDYTRHPATEELGSDWQ